MFRFSEGFRGIVQQHQVRQIIRAREKARAAQEALPEETAVAGGRGTSTAGSMVRRPGTGQVRPITPTRVKPQRPKRPVRLLDSYPNPAEMRRTLSNVPGQLDYRLAQIQYGAGKAKDIAAPTAKKVGRGLIGVLQIARKTGRPLLERAKLQAKSRRPQTQERRSATEPVEIHEGGGGMILKVNNPELLTYCGRFGVSHGWVGKSKDKNDKMMPFSPEEAENARRTLLMLA